MFIIYKKKEKKSTSQKTNIDCYFNCNMGGRKTWASLKNESSVFCVWTIEIRKKYHFVRSMKSFFSPISLGSSFSAWILAPLLTHFAMPYRLAVNLQTHRQSQYVNSTLSLFRRYHSSILRFSQRRSFRHIFFLVSVSAHCIEEKKSVACSFRSFFDRRLFSFWLSLQMYAHNNPINHFISC